MKLASFCGLVLVAVTVTGCSSSTTGAGASGSSGLAGSSSPTCADFGGACSKLGITGKCAAGTARVSEAASLCPATTPDCCVAPPSAGTVARVKDSGLVCTTAGAYPELAGTCGGQACQLGCTCGASGGSAECDCSRGLTPGSKSQEVCGVFACGVITCSAGCSCADAAQSACTCP